MNIRQAVALWIGLVLGLSSYLIWLRSLVPIVAPRTLLRLLCRLAQD